MIDSLTIALIAHDSRKLEIIDLLTENRSLFSDNRIHMISTENTGELARKNGFQVLKMLSGPLGGDAQIASMVVSGKCDMVIFLKDPLAVHPHESDINMLNRLCDVHNVPLATNRSTAKLLVFAIEKQFAQDLRKMA